MLAIWENGPDSHEPMAFDLQLNSSGDLDLRPSTITGAEAVAQNVRVRLTTHVGEWPQDAAVGLPYATWLGTKPVDLGSIVARIRRTVRETPGVVSVSGFTGSLSTAGVVTVTGSAVVEDGAVLDVQAPVVLTRLENAYPIVARIRNGPIVRAP